MNIEVFVARSNMIAGIIAAEIYHQQFWEWTSPENDWLSPILLKKNYHFIIGNFPPVNLFIVSEPIFQTGRIEWSRQSR